MAIRQRPSRIHPTRFASEQLEPRLLLAADPIRINFQPDGTINEAVHPELSGYVADDGDGFGDRGNGFRYGWLDGNLNPDDQRQTRNRNNPDSQDERFDTLNHMIKGDSHSWQIALENGLYDIRIMAGDPSHTDQVEDLELVSGLNSVSIDDPDGQDNWDEFNLAAFEVTNGLLRLSPRDSGNNQKLAFIELTLIESEEPSPAVLAVGPATGVTPFSAQLNGEVVSSGNAQTAVTLYYGDNDAGKSFGWDHSINMGFPNGEFQADIDSLDPGNQYFFRAFGLNIAGASWSDAATFSTPALDPPTVANNGVSDLTATSATIKGLASGSITPSVAIYWGDNDGGTNAGSWDNAVSFGETNEEVSFNLTELNDGTTYYFRTFAENAGGSTWASASTSFTTLTITPPVVDNVPVIDVEAFEAVVGGQINDSGNESPTVVLYWGDNDGGRNVASWDNQVDIGEQSGFFSTTLIDLMDDRRYFYRSAATNSAGTTWATATETFETKKVTVPSVKNDDVSQITSSSARLGGTVTDFGNDAPFVSIYYGTTDGGTDDAAWQQVVEFSPEFGSFAQTVLDLVPETEYFFRAKATNAAGTSWSPQSGTFTTLESPTLLITEFLTSNDQSLTTRIRESAGGALGEEMNPDWIEIHNPGDAAIDLGGLSLTDDVDNRNKWQFPAGTLLPGNGYLVVYASGEDIQDPSLDQTGRLHTNFRLSTGGEFLAITDGNGAVIHGYDAYPNQRSDISYGIDSTSTEHYYSGMTPGGANSDATINLVSDTTFSVNRGFYDAPFNLEVTTKTLGATLVYTTDGSEPTRTNGVAVAAPNEFTSPVANIQVSTTTLVRAFAYKSGFDDTNVDTHSYFFLNDVLHQATDPDNGRQTTPEGFPRSWGGATGDYQVDPDIVNHAQDSDRLVPDDLKSVPTISVVMDNDDLFGSNQIYLSGSGSPRPMSIELITADGKEEFQQNASIQVQGGSSTNRWKDFKLSLRVKFQAPFGPSKLKHALYADSTIDRYDNITLDGVLNHAWVHSGQHTMPQYIQDQYVADLHNAMGGHSPYGRFVHLYLNGLYWGMYYMHDRPDHAWAAEKFGGNKSEYHAVKHSGSNVINDGNGNRARDSYRAMEVAARAVQSDPMNMEKWDTLQQQLDVDNFITYLLANWFTGNHDWPHKNWYATAPDGGPWRFHSWDAEHATDSNNDVGESPSNLHSHLDGNPEYAMRMADLIHKHFFNDGPLTAETSAEMWRSRMEEIDRAIVGESARWGDNRSSRAHTREEWLRYNGDGRGLLGRYFPSRSGRVLGQLRAADLYPDLDAPEFAQHGGNVASGFPLAINNPDGRGTIYYTVDGSDPRLVGGGRNPASIAYNGEIALTETSALKARILDGGTWSALTEAQFIVSAAQPGDLVISEINYHPHATMPQFGEPNVDADEYEFVEIRNASDRTIDLAGTQFKQTALNGKLNGIDFQFASQQLAPGERVVVVSNRVLFEARYGTGIRIAEGSSGTSANPVSGQFSGQLANTGEQLTLVGFDGEILQQFRFNDGGNWPNRADGRGSSLELVANPSDPNLASSWRSSSEFGGTPGESGSGPSDDVVINELLTHTDLPQIDLIELRNNTGAAIDLSNWYISDSGADYFRFRIGPGTSIDPDGYLFFSENDLGFGFRGQESDDAWLIEADEMGRPIRFADHVRFQAAQNGVSLGRWPNGSGNLFSMTAASFGGTNSGPVISDVIVSEFNYQPAEPPVGSLLTRDELEYVEVWNAGATAVDIGDWRLDDAVDFTFGSGTVLPPSEGIVVVNFDPSIQTKEAAFRLAYGLDPNQSLMGPYGGKLDNGGETIELERPEDPEQVGLGYILVDHVAYDDQSPWPTEADGGGLALHRQGVDAFGDFASSWLADSPTPGSASFDPPPNSDLNGDGTVDPADIDFLCTSLSGNDLSLDFNGDGILNNDDHEFFVIHVLGSTIGDANLDKVFNSTDLIQIFQANEYEDGIEGNSTWAEGDWNCNGDFDSGDLIDAFKIGGYVSAAVARGTLRSQFGSSQFDEIRSESPDEKHDQTGTEPKVEVKKAARIVELDLPAVEQIDLLFDDFAERHDEENNGMADI